jgi:hypothetical protein
LVRVSVNDHFGLFVWKQVLDTWVQWLDLQITEEEYGTKSGAESQIDRYPNFFSAH